MKSKKKFLVMLALLAGISASQLFSFGIGAQGGFGGFGGGGQVAFQFSNSPIIFALGVHVYDGNLRVSLASDWWIINPVLTSGDNWSLNWFFGVGLGAWVGFNDFNLGAQVRVPIGINFYCLDKRLEFFLQGVPNVGIGIVPIDIPAGGWVSANLGFRYWTKSPVVGGKKR
jgi:hypothetical protein